MIEVATDTEAGASRATVDGDPAGRLGFRIAQSDGSAVWTLYTTVVDRQYEGHGVGSALVRDVIERADAAGAVVHPTCWFVAGWLDRHPQYQHLLPDDMR